MSDLPTADGVYPGVPFADYLRIQRAHKSALQHLETSPLHYLHYRQHGIPDTDLLRRGHAAHTAVLEPHRFLKEYALWTGKVRRGKDWDAFSAALGGRVDISQKDYDTAITIGKAVHAHPLTKPYFESGQPEVTVLFTDATSGQPCKVRLDWLRDDCIVELKTTGNLDPFRWFGVAYRLGYHIQAAMYVDAIASVTGNVLPYRIIAAEQGPPHDVAVFQVPEEILDRGREDYGRLLERLAVCVASNIWPGRFSGEQTMQLPRYALNDEDVSGLGLDFGEETP